MLISVWIYSLSISKILIDHIILLHGGFYLKVVLQYKVLCYIYIGNTGSVIVQMMWIVIMLFCDPYRLWYWWRWFHGRWILRRCIRIRYDMKWLGWLGLQWVQQVCFSSVVLVQYDFDAVDFDDKMSDKDSKHIPSGSCCLKVSEFNGEIFEPFV